MTVYDTTTLAIAILGEEKISTNRKAATRTLRKFLRTDFRANEVATPGKGGRYAIELKAAELRAMKKRYAEWEKAEAKAQEARRAALAASKAPITDATDEAPESTPEAASDEEPIIEGPSDEEIAEMLSDLDDADTEA